MVLYITSISKPYTWVDVRALHNINAATLPACTKAGLEQLFNHLCTAFENTVWFCSMLKIQRRNL